MGNQCMAYKNDNGRAIKSKTCAEFSAGRDGLNVGLFRRCGSRRMVSFAHVIKPGGIVVLGAFAGIGPMPFVEEKTVVGSLLGSRQQMLEVLQLEVVHKIRSICDVFPLKQAEDEPLLRLRRAVLAP